MYFFENMTKDPEWHYKPSDNSTVYWRIDQDLDPATIWTVHNAFHDVLSKNPMMTDQKKIEELMSKKLKSKHITGFKITRIERKKK